MLWCVKEFRRGRTMIADVLRPTQPPDKSEHEWGQSEAGVGVLVENLTEPGELIVDPFAGTAYWGTLATNLGVSMDRRRHQARRLDQDRRVKGMRC